MCVVVDWGTRKVISLSDRYHWSLVDWGTREVISLSDRYHWSLPTAFPICR
jgi:hypothetical protein